MTRKARAKYTHTPDWEYYDLNKRAAYVGWDMSSYKLQVLVVPEKGIIYSKDDPLSKGPEWVKGKALNSEGGMSHKMWNRLYDAVDDQCKKEDAKRRRRAKRKKSRDKPN